jgi:hypothetical protein
MQADAKTVAGHQLPGQRGNKISPGALRDHRGLRAIRKSCVTRSRIVSSDGISLGSCLASAIT